ncbi:unnamed protein product [Soboliphyme baturini]|uniref:EGF-like domain-containing protein n=1 Tax=Soboliphyme baturini TaxID=241478 RepID=A0A183IEI7_9BILA|nr:unnamed protein product [Soboliphyme baturini]
MDASSAVDLSIPLTFYGQSYRRIYILSNGAIGFDRNSQSYFPNVLKNGKTPLIAPLWSLNDLRLGGHVFYRELTAGRSVDRARSEIRYQYDKTVRVLSVLLVTWSNVKPVGSAAGPSEKSNTFQAVIILSDNGTFANFVYKNTELSANAEAGFTKGDSEHFFILPSSRNPSTQQLKDFGNTGIPGEWIFRIDLPRIVRCKEGIKGDTCDTECGQNEWGNDCENCCFCATGSCDPTTGRCPGECGRCWRNPPFCQREECFHFRCALNAISFSQPGRCGITSIQCQCMTGYKGDGFHCEDIDECEAKVCDRNAQCVNTPGKYFCQCLPGFTGNGTVYLASHQRSGGQFALPRRSLSHLLYDLKQPLVIFGRQVHKLTVNSGLVSLNNILPVRYEDPIENSGFRGFAPFYGRIDLTQSNGTVSVQESTESVVLTAATDMISQHFNLPSFMARSVVMISFEDVSASRNQGTNTFVVTLIGGTLNGADSATFVDFMYEKMQWSEGAQAMIITDSSDNSLQLPGSGTDGVKLLSVLSNIREPGQWIFRVDKEKVEYCAEESLRPPYCEHSDHQGNVILCLST